MNLSVTLEHRFALTPDGKAWSKTMFGHQFWERYLTVFKSVTIAARCLPVQDAPDGWRVATGEGVNVFPLPHYKGPREFVQKYWPLRRAVSSLCDSADAFILRVPSPIGGIAAKRLRSLGRPYGVEVVGDPWAVFAKGGVRHPLRPVLRFHEFAQLRGICKNAAAAAYVTENYLQERYPCGPSVYSTNYSSVELPESAFAESCVSRPLVGGAINMIAIGSLENHYKGADTLLQAVAILRNVYQMPVTLAWVGDGMRREQFEAMAESLGVSQYISFVGRVTSGKPVRDLLDQADLFVLASRTEGLPRALIEAMARGVPCVATDVGGVGELLHSDFMCPPDSPDALASLIKKVAVNPVLMRRMGDANLSRARDYADSAQDVRRLAFYGAVYKTAL